jgi:hypothetical protein
MKKCKRWQLAQVAQPRSAKDISAEVKKHFMTHGPPAAHSKMKENRKKTKANFADKGMSISHT